MLSVKVGLVVGCTSSAQRKPDSLEIDMWDEDIKYAWQKKESAPLRAICLGFLWPSDLVEGLIKSL